MAVDGSLGLGTYRLQALTHPKFGGGPRATYLDLTDAAGLGLPEPSVAVLLPCRNEESTIAKVVRDFQEALPQARVFVYDNGSTDRTADEATRAGAIVRDVPEPGKGNVLRRMFSEIESDIYVIADGDDTYDATRAPELVELLVSRGLDMVVGSRLEEDEDGAAYRPGHRAGNRIFNRTVKALFGERPADMFTGYRVFSRRYAKSFPAIATGFEVETEMTLHAMDLRLPVMEVATLYRERPANSVSKLNTYRDGARILRFLLGLFHAYRPMVFYGALALLTLIGGVAAALALSSTVIVLAGSVAAGLAMILAGACLDAVRRGQREVKRMLYLSNSRTSGGDDWL